MHQKSSGLLSISNPNWWATEDAILGSNDAVEMEQDP